MGQNDAILDLILSYWFAPERQAAWFDTPTTPDEEMCHLFEDIYEDALAGHYNHWVSSPRGALALVLLLTVFARRMFAGTAKAYETDFFALAIAKEALLDGFDCHLPSEQRFFLFLPFLKSEDFEDQLLASKLFADQFKDPLYLHEAEKSLRIIEHFGHFPQRNAALGRISTAEELKWLGRRN